MSVTQGAVYAASYAIPSGVISGSTVTLSVTAPDGVVTTPTVTQAVTSTATVPATKVGPYLLTWTSSGTVVDVLTDQFTVVAPSLSLLGLADLKDQLNISTTDTSGTAKLRRFLQSATDVVQNVTGPILPLTRTDVFDGDVQFVVLPFRWVKSITSVTETRGNTNYTLTNQPLGSSVDSFGYTWDQNTNKIIRRTYGGADALFAPGMNVVTVSYVAGMSTIPQDISDATGELIRHWWSNGQTAFSNPFAATSDDGEPTQMVMGYAIPNRVVEMLAPYARRPGIF